MNHSTQQNEQEKPKIQNQIVHKSTVLVMVWYLLCLCWNFQWLTSEIQSSELLISKVISCLHFMLLCLDLSLAHFQKNIYFAICYLLYSLLNQTYCTGCAITLYSRMAKNPNKKPCSLGSHRVRSTIWEGLHESIGQVNQIYIYLVIFWSVEA